eukprot:CAMPEP_0114995650 /NCGR_PEP_ID=MMETSP0216-20121206/13852_1 /TAXON_ID=223996 /ORGANISM="Protocruzia adherens, Strain Boccale" /LENGTH=518 /DNA_ID=CAMNT_0002359725 /DNA_START=274 /DNA_END=1830 /DNA_ORIENTATION=+
MADSDHTLFSPHINQQNGKRAITITHTPKKTTFSKKFYGGGAGGHSDGANREGDSFNTAASTNVDSRNTSRQELSSGASAIHSDHDKSLSSGIASFFSSLFSTSKTQKTSGQAATVTKTGEESRQELREELQVRRASVRRREPEEPTIQISVDVLCVNCQEMIPALQIESHSLVCLEVSDSVTIIDKCSSLQQLDFRINKLKKAIALVIENPTDSVALANEVHYYSSMLNYAEKLLNAENADERCLNVCLNVGKNLQVLAGSFKGGPSTMVYIERLKLLAREKHTQISVEMGIHGATQVEREAARRIEEKQRELKNITRARKFYENEVLQKKFGSTNQEFDGPKNSRINDEGNFVMNEVESEIDTSSVYSRASLQSDLSSLSSRGDLSIGNSPYNKEIQDLDQEYKIQKEDASRQRKEDLQRYFYSQCLSIKLQFSTKDLAQHVQISSLYKKAVMEKVPIEQWPAFIKQELKEADKWVDANKIKQRGRKKGTGGKQKNTTTKKGYVVEPIAEEDSPRE